VTTIEAKFAWPTVKEVEPLIGPEVAVMVAVPCPELVASPLLPTALLIIATAADDELQVAVVVTSCVVPSVYVPVARNCCIVPSAIDESAGVIASEARAAGFTASVAVWFMLPELTPIVVEPVASVLASPAVAAVLLIVATVETVELQ
jgi:hypothetical protein